MSEAENEQKTAIDPSVRVEGVVMRPPISKRERMIAAINSTGADLYQHNGRVIVTGRALNGDTVELGSVNESALCARGVNPRSLIGRVRFGT